MDEARILADELGEMGEEGDDVVLRHLFDLVDARDVEFRFGSLLPDRAGGFCRDHAKLGHRLAGISLDLEPDAKARLRRPDGDHVGTGIAGDHEFARILNWLASCSVSAAVYRKAGRESRRKCRVSL
jgi:hypothetical protein